jgi:hypothetical protein
VIADFTETGSRELVADDYIYQIKRLAHPRLHSPIFSMMSERIIGLPELGGAARGSEKAAAERLAGSRSFPAGWRHAPRSLQLSHRVARQVSAVPLLAGDAFLRAGAA